MVTDKAVFLWLLALATAQSCLKDAIQEETRRPAVEGKALQLASYSWENSRITAAAAQIILEERMGVQVQRAAVLGGSHLGPPALAGDSACQEADNFARCDVSNPSAHFIFDAWGGGEKSYNQMNSTIQPIMAAMGYMGREGTFVPNSAVQAGLGMSPQVFMDFYKSYNSSNLDLTNFMASQAQVEEKIVELGLTKARCSREEIPQAHSGCSAYEQATGDHGLYEWSADGLGGQRCDINCDNDWILSPACRQRPGSCVAWVSTGDGWGVEEMLQQAVFWNIALAVVVLPEWGDYTTLPLEIPSLWFWFFPDPAFMAVGPTKLQEPPTDNGERAARIFRTGADAIVIHKFQWRLLPTFAPQIHEFLTNVVFSPSDVTELMTNASLGQDLDDIACQWVRQNEDTWSNWLPRADECAAGWAFDAGEGRCTRCLAGSYSTGPGSGNVSCQQCTAGTFSNRLGSTGCASCDAGHFSSFRGNTACSVCQSGRYGDSRGQTACAACAEGPDQHLWTTMRNIDSQWVPMDGATSSQSCGCAVGARMEGSVCLPCEMEGIACIGMGEVLVSEGYMSDIPLSVFECFATPKACPGGRPGDTCQGGRFSHSCSECREGSLPQSDGSCKVCEGGDSATPVAILGSCAVVLAIVYVLTARRVQDPSAPSQAVLMGSIALGQLIGVVQQLSVIAYFSVDYGDPVNSFLDFFTIFAFNIEYLRVGCLGSLGAVGRYCLKLLILFGAFVLLALVHVVYVLTCHQGKFQELRPSLVATVGVMMMALFTSIVVVVLGPLQCNKHPNGKYSMASYEAVVCWDFENYPQQMNMLAISIVGMMGPIAFYAQVCYVVRYFPKKMKELDDRFMKSYSMFFFRLRQGAHGYLLVLVSRALLVALVPVIRSATAQIFILQTLLLFSQAWVYTIMPWRHWKLNYLDGLFTLCMLYFANLAAFSVDDVNLTGVGWMVVICMLGALALVPLLFGYVLLKKCGPRKKTFQYFLCRVRSETGSFSRFLKMEMEEQPQIVRGVFLDTDNLDDLDKLLSYVAHDVNTFVVILSKCFFYRAWCAGELTVAFQKNVDAVLIKVPGFADLSEAQLDALLDELPDIECLIESGLKGTSIVQAVKWVNGLPAFVLESEQALGAPPQLAKNIAQGKRSGVLSGDNSLVSNMTSARTEGDMEIGIGICANLSDLEGSASAGIVKKMLVPRILLSQKQAADIIKEGMPVPSAATALVLVGTNGCLLNPNVVGLLWQAAQRTLQVLPIVCEEHFKYPSPEMFKDFSEEDVTPLPGGGVPTKLEIALMMQDVFREIAIVMRTRSASVMMLTVAANDAAARLLTRKVHTVKASSYFAEKASTIVSSNSVKERYGALTPQGNQTPRGGSENHIGDITPMSSVKSDLNAIKWTATGSKTSAYSVTSSLKGQASPKDLSASPVSRTKEADLHWADEF